MLLSLGVLMVSWLEYKSDLSGAGLPVYSATGCAYREMAQGH